MNDRSKQLERALNMLEKKEELVSAIVPAHTDLHTGEWRPAEFVDIYMDQLDICKQIYGTALIIVN